MLLLVGLGNPGPQYAFNRHNIGFMAVDAIVHRHSFSPARQRFQGITHDGTLGGEKVIALKPMTYMNESGRSVGEAMRFFKLEPQDVVVIHDELDLPAGKLRIKTGGGAGGHNGIKSIIQHIGENFRRVRIGIGHPGARDKVLNAVLGDFSKTEMKWVEPLLDIIVAEAPLLGEGRFNSFANRIHLALNPEPPKEAKPKPGPKSQKENGDE
ncbi:MAG: aminoacyl-tRNA hydrolase [Parvibaculum sp.]|uniref:aminoacyl-tRNA hydrolase n=1 Tax=Parvibaculum sp. TaxID=2024848 RepID=UPI0025E1D138|nr:aminoacyl-tRNA hydrolase [Parvibaculum sp.]MCE9649472.1 aminoacyl-tRNA hydrolase [Parvibaculum sp.]